MKIYAQRSGHDAGQLAPGRQGYRVAGRKQRRGHEAVRRLPDGQAVSALHQGPHRYSRVIALLGCARELTGSHVAPLKKKDADSDGEGEKKKVAREERRFVFVATVFSHILSARSAEGGQGGQEGEKGQEVIQFIFSFHSRVAARVRRSFMARPSPTSASGDAVSRGSAP